MVISYQYGLSGIAYKFLEPKVVKKGCSYSWIDFEQDTIVDGVSLLDNN